MKIKQLLAGLALLAISGTATAQKTIYAYATGNWRNGPVVQFSPVFETTERFAIAQLEQWVRGQWPEAFTDTTDITIQLFTTPEAGVESRDILKTKYGMRKLPVNMIGAAELPRTPERPE